jgi:superfamily I DNA and/or RNA helicase
VQRDLIADFLEIWRRQDPALDAFFSNGGIEEVFVKNLENVQGDERDVILISVGYGPRVAGEPLDSMAFGPVSNEGGERRLNVLFTRPRVRCEVFVSFDPGDINLERTTGDGPRVLKRFLRYAENGILQEFRAF